MSKSSNQLAHMIAAFYRSASLWNGWSLIVRLFIFGTSTVFIFFAEWPLWPAALFFLSLGVEMMSWRSERQRAMAESLKRTKEVCDGLGKMPDAAKLADQKAEAFGGGLPKADEATVAGMTFFSVKGSGSERLLENTLESSWWSRHLARKAGFIFAFLIALMTLCSLGYLLFTLSIASESTNFLSLTKVITSVLLLLFSLNLVKDCVSLFEFANSSQEARIRSEQLLREGKAIKTSVALQVLHDYQLARSGAPPIPTWIWKANRDHLNQTWAEYQHNQEKV